MAVEYNSLAPLDGTDGVAPVYNPDGRFQIWALDQVYLGKEGKGKYVPNVGDYVIDRKKQILLTVESLNTATLIPSFETVDNGLLSSIMSPVDKAVGINYEVPDTLRIYIDDTVIPHTMAIDESYLIASSEASYVTVTIGNALDGTERTISNTYDQVGNLISQNIPVANAYPDNNLNHVMKVVPTMYTTEEIKDGEILTLYIYNNSGNVIGVKPMLAINTGFIRQTFTGTKHVTGISMRGPFMDSSDDNLLRFPVNVNLSALQLSGVVHYSDGSELVMPIDGVKFMLHGFNSYVATTPDQRRELVLVYVLDRNEAAYGPDVNSGAISKHYFAQATNRDSAYDVKLFGYPVFIDNENGYRMEYFMISGDRLNVHKVTSYITYNAVYDNFGKELPGFDGKRYGVEQLLSVSLRLDRVHARYKPVMFTQTMEVSLLENATDHTGDPWLMASEPNQQNKYGANFLARVDMVNAGRYSINLANKHRTVETWLNAAYYNTRPMYLPDVEARPPQPNMFGILKADGTYAEFTVEQYNQNLVVDTVLKDGDTLFVKFFRRSNNNDIVLGMTGINVTFLK